MSADSWDVWCDGGPARPRRPRRPPRCLRTERMRRAFGVVGGVWALLHLYVGMRLVGHGALGPGAEAGEWLALGALAAAPFAAFGAMRANRVRWAGAVQWIGFT